MMKNKKGMTLVEVIVAFSILLLVIALFSQAIHVSLNLSKKADELLLETTKAVNQYYEDSAKDSSQKTVKIVFTPANSPAGETFGMNSIITYNGDPINEKSLYYFKTIIK